jgi:hypothetical protein
MKSCDRFLVVVIGCRFRLLRFGGDSSQDEVAPAAVGSIDSVVFFFSWEECPASPS